MATHLYRVGSKSGAFNMALRLRIKELRQFADVVISASRQEGS